MNNSAQITAAALITAATTGFAAAGSLELDRAYASELKADAGTRSVLNQGNLSNLEVHVGVRFGYSFNSRDGSALGDSDTTMGFNFSEAEVALEGDVTDNMHARLSFDFGPDNSDSLGGEGTGHLEDAFVDWAVNDDFSLRVGQFIPSYSAEASTSEFHMMNSYRSVTHEFLGTPSWTQGVEASFGGDTWTFAVGFNDGPNTASTAFNSMSEADYGFNARFDFYSDSDHGRFADQTSWRGSENGWRAGAGLMFATYGNTNPAATTTESDNFFWTIDGAYEGDGWAVRAAFYSSNIDPNAGTEHTNYGFELGGSFFFNDQWEGFARWDTLMLDDDTGAGQVVASGEEVQNFVAIGANYYFVPESQAAKFTLELGMALDETADIANTAGDLGTTPIGAPGSSGFLVDSAGENGQFMVSGTMQWLF
ncbi:MAG: porin [Phycisphaerales bacterium]|nr:porin [Phycisphaerales bacterium]